MGDFNFMIHTATGVDCRFETDGSLTIHKISLNGRWRKVEQGRQWRDDDGHHLLVMIGGQVFTLTLHAHTLQWDLAGRTGHSIAV